MGTTWRRWWLPIVIVGVLASVGVAAGGEDDEGDDNPAQKASSDSGCGIGAEDRSLQMTVPAGCR